MKYDEVFFETRQIDNSWEIPHDCYADLLIGGISTTGNEIYYFISLGNKKITRCEIINISYRKSYAKYLELRMSKDDIPYGINDFDGLMAAFVQPHEGVMLPDGRIAISMHNTDYIRILDIKNEKVSVFPETDEYQGTVYSATNSMSENRYYFAQWSIDDRIIRYKDKEKLIPIHIKSIDKTLNESSIADIVTTRGAEGFHEVKCSPDESYLILTEFCLQANDKVPFEKVDNTTWKNFNEWVNYEQRGLQRPSIQCVDLRTKKIDIATPRGNTPGHVEFCLTDNNRIYLSCHEMSKTSTNIILHRQGILEEFEIKNSKLWSSRYFSTPGFLRLTSHKVFYNGDKNLIAITVFPNYLYIFEDGTLELLEKVKLFDAPNISTTHMHICTLDDRTPLWLDTSDNGQYVILISNAYVYTYHIQKQELKSFSSYNWYLDFIGTAHVTNMNDFQ